MGIDTFKMGVLELKIKNVKLKMRRREENRKMGLKMELIFNF